jgi:hypothetical protein
MNSHRRAAKIAEEKFNFFSAERAEKKSFNGFQ